MEVNVDTRGIDTNPTEGQQWLIRNTAGCLNSLTASNLKVLVPAVALSALVLANPLSLLFIIPTAPLLVRAAPIAAKAADSIGNQVGAKSTSAMNWIAGRINTKFAERNVIAGWQRQQNEAAMHARDLRTIDTFEMS